MGVLGNEGICVRTNEILNFSLVDFICKRKKRERMSGVIKTLGLTPILPDGGYFMVANASKLKAGLGLNL